MDQNRYDFNNIIADTQVPIKNKTFLYGLQAGPHQVLVLRMEGSKASHYDMMW